jgi:general stress protein 26
MNNEGQVDKVWALMEKIGFCMLSTLDGDAIRARPMAARVDRAENAIYFLTDINSHKDDEIAKRPNVGLAFADTDGQKYVSVTGRASVSNDRAKIKDLWSPAAKAWWESADDPAIRVLKVEPDDAQYWDSPGTVMSYVKMFAAAVSDARSAIGENHKVAL